MVYLREGVMVISQREEQVTEIALNRDASVPIELASLSKAITAVSTVTLIDTAVWTLE
jgi:hypothetical protein